MMYQFALIGCGRIAARHAENILQHGQLKAVCDTDKAKADAFAATYGATAYYSIDDLVKGEKDVAIISICTPNGLHAEHSIKSLQAGKHVLCEKPLCLTSAAAWQMIETEKFSRRKLFVVKSTRFNPLVKSLKAFIDEGKLGTIYSFQLHCLWNRPPSYYTDWRGKLFPDGGTLYTQFSHYIDILIWMMGNIVDVKGFSNNYAHQNTIEFEDTGVVALQMENGALGTFNWSVNSYLKNFEIGLTIVAEKGTLQLGGPYLNEVKYQNLLNPFQITEVLPQPNDYGFYNGSMSNHKEVYDYLVEELGSETNKSNAFDGLRTVEAIEKIYKALSKG